MKYESCRKCGVQLQESQNEDDKCVVCNEITSFVCPKCGWKTDPQIHQHINEVIQTQTPILVKGGNRD